MHNSKVFREVKKKIERNAQKAKVSNAINVSHFQPNATPHKVENIICNESGNGSQSVFVSAFYLGLNHRYNLFVLPCNTIQYLLVWYNNFCKRNEKRSKRQ